MKTKAAILVEQKKDLVVDEIEVPKLETGKVLVEIKSTRICGSQLGEVDGVKGPDRYLPHTPWTRGWWNCSRCWNRGNSPKSRRSRCLPLATLTWHFRSLSLL